RRETRSFAFLMFNSSYAGRRASRAAGWWLCSLLASAWAMVPAPVFATCLISADPAIRELQTLVDKDATRALQQVGTQLQLQEGAPRADAPRLASLYAVQAQAYGILELDNDAKNSALKGLKFATLATDPVHIDLLSTYAENVYDAAGMGAAIKSIDAARASQVKGSLADTCLLITRGLLQYRQDRADLAIGSLTQAYYASTAPEYALPRIISA